MVVEQTKGYIAERKALTKTLLALDPKLHLQSCIVNCAFMELGCCYNPKYYTRETQYQGQIGLRWTACKYKKR